MIKKYLFLLLPFVLAFLVQQVFAQTDTLFKIPDPEFTKEEKIGQARQLLRAAFIAAADVQTNAWLDTLTLRLEDSMHMACYPEERWMLWYFTGNYARIFRDLDTFNYEYQWQQQFKMQPPQDSFIFLIDEIAAENPAELFIKIRNSTLSPEEKGFAALHLEFLLTPRPTETEIREQDDIALNFLKLYPKSRFSRYILDHIYSYQRTSDKGTDLDFMGVFGRPDGRMGLNLKPLYGISMGIFYRNQKFALGGRAGIGLQKVRRDFEVKSKLVAKDSLGFNFYIGPEMGYMFVHKPQIDVGIHAGAGLSVLTIPTENPDLFRSHTLGFYLLAGLILDYRLGNAVGDPEENYGNDYHHSLRIFAGYQLPGYPNSISTLQGNIFVIGAGINLQYKEPYKIPE